MTGRALSEHLATSAADSAGLTKDGTKASPSFSTTQLARRAKYNAHTADLRVCIIHAEHSHLLKSEVLSQGQQELRLQK
eukprot:CAMPEP_0181290364 /NCGR_PEP_ID=MMETSP1101-20121128/1374_1 /TAXON_ID=46948 /ORGANISM="Rhodomonas abbreviata, Strain Caron Lab Isolate" /LENGTH=78 /DNA_ID=CAMNT_0023394643 /DNA_START=951 /DNA_END=1187 /DNA_ORIENTATION=-